MRNGKRMPKVRARRVVGPSSDRSTVVRAGEETIGTQSLGLHASLTFGDDANVRSLVSSTLVPLVFSPADGEGGVNAGIVRFCPGDFLSANCIANIWGGTALNSVAGDDSAADLLIASGDMYAVTGVSVEFIPEVAFLDRGGAFVISRFSRQVTTTAGNVAVEDLLPPLSDPNAWSLEAAAAAGEYPQELENVNRIEFGEFTLPIYPLDPRNGHMFTRRDPDGTAYEVAANPSASLAAVAFLDSPEFLSKVAAWGMVQFEYIAPAGLLGLDPGHQYTFGHFRIRRSIQEVYLPSADVPMSFTLAAGIQPAIVLPDEVKDDIYAKEAQLAVRNTPVTGKGSFAKAVGQVGNFFKGALETAQGVAVAVQSALAQGVSYIREHPEVAETAIQAAAMIASRGRSAPKFVMSKAAYGAAAA